MLLARAVRTVAAVAVLGLLAGACSAGDDGAGGADGDAAGAEQPDAEAGGDAGGDAVEPAPLPWSEDRLAEDLRAIAAYTAEHDRAWEIGSEAAYTFLAVHAWPAGYTADALRICLEGEPAPTFSQLDAAERSVRLTLEDPEPVPGWRFPPTDEAVLDAGLRVYRVLRSETRLELDAAPSERSGPSHVAVDDDGRVVGFPACTAHLPGGRPEVQRALDEAFGDLGPFALAATCEIYREVGAEATLEALLEDGWDVTLMEVRTAYHDWCADIWESPQDDGEVGSER